MNTITPAKKPEITYIEPESPKQPDWGKLMFALLFFAAVIYAAFNMEDFVVENEGQLELSSKRKAKLEKELNEIDNAVQYALIVDFSGEFPCLNCGDRTTIFLNKGETWKYGTTRLGEKGRYQSTPFDDRLIFVPQFFGNYSECLKVEKIKIYNYVLLPENQKRELPTVRPPGNPYDN